ncbi:MAG TPA: 5-formyltetrahydrofolate cyclo-ligase [Mycobacteriales bacterium]|nr:5-formyltetrahydrofolate cyclo-ligase [Mycobacteriales bacterium]
MSTEGGKRGWRARLLADRAALSPDRLRLAAETLTRHVLDRLGGMGRIAAYVPVGREPGSVRLLDALRDGGTEVLLPVVVDRGLDWAPYAGAAALMTGALGTLAPDGPRVGAAGIATADAVLIPALAVDHRGVRLGRGGGYYDRALAVVPAQIPLIALLHDGELVERLPADPWDRTVTAAVSPVIGWTELPIVEHHDD